MSKAFVHTDTILEVGNKYLIANLGDPGSVEIEFRGLIDTNYVVYRRPSYFHKDRLTYHIMHINKFKSMLQNNK